jgi:hypothetical protein
MIDFSARVRFPKLPEATALPTSGFWASDFRFRVVTFAMIRADLRAKKTDPGAASLRPYANPRSSALSAVTWLGIER